MPFGPWRWKLRRDLRVNICRLKSSAVPPLENRSIIPGVRDAFCDAAEENGLKMRAEGQTLFLYFTLLFVQLKNHTVWWIMSGNL